MNTKNLLGIVCLGLLLRGPALAQTTAPTKASPALPATSAVPPPTSLPSTIPPGAVPANATTPIGTSGPIYLKGVPIKNLDGGTQRADQPVGGTRGGIPATAGSQPVKRLHKGRSR